MSLADAVPFAVAAWTLDEASGTRFDSIGSNDLSDNNTVLSAAGMFGDAADFEAGNSEYLSVADNAAVSTGDVDFMWRAWVKLESKAATMTILSKWGGDDAQREYILFYNAGSDRFSWGVRQSGGGGGLLQDADNLGSPSTGVWYLIHCWHDATNNQVGIAVNAGTANAPSYSDGVNEGTDPLRFGQNADSNYFDGLIDDPVLLKDYILDATERTEDYNGGTGVAFAGWAGGGGGGNRRRRLILCGSR